MSVEIIRGKPDKYSRAFKKTLEKYVAKHPGSSVQIYRHNPGMIRVRVIDASMKQMDLFERNDYVWKWLEELPLDTLNEMGTLTLVTPEEVKTSMASLDFDNPATFSFS